jgi:hypothetical protein
MTPRKLVPKAPNLRVAISTIAEDLGVCSADYERAMLCAQIAQLFYSDRRLGQRIAFKGGVVARLSEASPRVSRDLDAVDVLARGLGAAQVTKLLTDRARAPFILSVDRPTRTDHLAYWLRCRTFSGDVIDLRLTIHWIEKPMLPRRIVSVVLPGGQTVQFPALDFTE